MQDPISDKVIVIEPVDKGNVIVIWDKERKNHLNDFNVYGGVTGDPLETLKQKIKIVLIKVLKENEIDKTLHDYFLLKILSSHAFAYLKSKNV